MPTPTPVVLGALLALQCSCFRPTLSKLKRFQILPSTVSSDGHIRVHHTSIKVFDIARSMKFYSLFGFKEYSRFLAGSARAVWLKSYSGAQMLELIEVPRYLNPANKTADLYRVDLASRTGLNHITLDVSEEAKRAGSLALFMQRQNQLSEQNFDRSIRLVADPHQQLIGQEIYEVSFIADPDDVLLELLSFSGLCKKLVEPDW